VGFSGFLPSLYYTILYITYSLSYRLSARRFHLYATPKKGLDIYHPFSYIILVESVFLILYYRRTFPDQYTKNPHHCQVPLTNRHTPHSTPNAIQVYIIPVIGQIHMEYSIMTNCQAPVFPQTFSNWGLDIE